MREQESTRKEGKFYIFFLKKYSWILETVVVNLHRAEDTTTPPKIGEKEKEKGGAGEEKEEGE